MKFTFILLFFAVTGILFLGNLVISKAILFLMPDASRSIAALIKITPLLLTAGFIASLFLGRHFYTFFTRILSTISASWMGFFFYLLLASILFGIIVYVGKDLLPFHTLQLIGSCLFLLAIGTSILGLIQARNIRVTRVSVTLPNLPTIWDGRTAVFISDIHLGQIYGAGFMRKVVNEINSLHPDIIFIGGDLYDGTAVDTKEVSLPLQDLNPQLGTYFVTGNHEEYNKELDFMGAVQETGIEVLNDRFVELEGIQIAGVSYSSGAHREQLEQILTNFNLKQELPSILLKHEPRDIDVVAEQNISLQLSGHTHRAQIWPLSYIPQKMYGGFDYGLKDLAGTHVYTSSGVGTWGPPLRVNTRSEIVLITFSKQ